MSMSLGSMSETGKNVVAVDLPFGKGDPWSSANQVTKPQEEKENRDVKRHRVTFVTPAKKVYPPSKLVTGSSLPAGGQAVPFSNDDLFNGVLTEKGQLIELNTQPKLVGDAAVDRTSCSGGDVQFEEEFRPATEVFGSATVSDLELDFLDNVGGNSDRQAAVTLARQSLYVRFDPLVDKPVLPAPQTPILSKAFVAGNDLLQLDTPEKLALPDRAPVSNSLIALPEEPCAAPVSAADCKTVACNDINQLLFETPPPVQVAPPDQSLQALPVELQFDPLNNMPSAVPAATAELHAEVDLELFGGPVPVEPPADVQKEEVVDHSTSDEVPNLTSRPACQSPDDLLFVTPRKETTEVVAAPANCTDNLTMADEKHPVSRGPLQSESMEETDDDMVLKFSQVDLQCHIDEAVSKALAEIAQQTEKETSFFKEELNVLSTEQAEVRSQIERQQKELTEMRHVVADYTEALAKNTEHVDSKKKTLMDQQERLLAQNRQLTGDYRSLEDSFIDLQRRHEKTRLTLESYHTSEKTLRETERKLREEFKGLEKANKKMKADTVEELRSCNSQLERLRNTHASDKAILTANIKKATLQAESLERTLRQKEESSRQLNAICDDMMKQMQKA